MELEDGASNEGDLRVRFELSRKMRFYVWNCYLFNFFPKSMSIETFIVAATIHPRPIVNDEPCLWPRTMLVCLRWLYEGNGVWEPDGEARFATNHPKYPAELCYHRYNRHPEDIGRTNYPSISPVVPPFPHSPPPHPIHELIMSHKLCFEKRGCTGVINRPKRYSTMKGRSAGRRKNSAGSVFGHVIRVHSNKKTTKSLWNERRRCRWKGCSLSTAR